MLLIEAMNPKEIRPSLGLLTEKAWKELYFRRRRKPHRSYSVSQVH